MGVPFSPEAFAFAKLLKEEGSVTDESVLNVFNAHLAEGGYEGKVTMVEYDPEAPVPLHGVYYREDTGVEELPYDILEELTDALSALEKEDA